jgi:hypothetical protein
MRIANLNDRLVLLTTDGSAVDVEQITTQMQSSGELHQTFYAG